MLESLIALAFALGGNIIIGVVWGIRLEGKVKVQDTRIDDVKELISTRFDAVDQRLSRIERSLNGALRHD